MGLPDELLRKPSKDDTTNPLNREQSSYNPLFSYRLPHGEQKQYMQQFGDMYFLRLAKLKPVVEAVAEEEWEDFEIAGEHAQRVERVLDVRQGQLCWVAGTIYMDMPLKPNILEDISKEHWIAGPPPRQSYFSNEQETQIMLEDESGRLRLTGAMLKNTLLVTGVIIAVLGTENANGDFEVLDMQIPNLPKQPQRWERDGPKKQNGDNMEVDTPHKKIAIVSGLDISGTRADNLRLALLSEWLLGEALGSEDQESTTNVARLVIAGNSISSDVIIDAAPGEKEASKKAASKKYGYDAAAYNATPTTMLDHFLAELLPSLPITVMPGEHDPANLSLPQQGVHNAMFPHSRAYASRDATEQEPGWFDSVTNPWEGDIEGWRLLGTSGQPLDDVLKYIEIGGPNGSDADGRLEVMESMLRWRCTAPTAPDTLWCYPFQERDQFVIEECPHVYFMGNQPRFDTTLIDGPVGQQVRLLTVPRFHTTGEVVLLDTETLEVEVVKFDVEDDQDSMDQHTAVSTSKVLLVPYCQHHVPKYHEWMKDPTIQEATASEPLSVDEEYSMQRSWRTDPDKLTFIVCNPYLATLGLGTLAAGKDDSANDMRGDVNMFLSIAPDSSPQSPRVVGELELMIAEQDQRRKGYGRAALLAFITYVTAHQISIVGNYLNSKSMTVGWGNTNFACLSAKIGQNNHSSVALFESVGFKKTSEEASYWGEYELRHPGFTLQEVENILSAYHINGYQEIGYKPSSGIA